MNTGAGSAYGDVLLFLHADTRLPQNALEDIRCALADAGIVAGAFRLKLDSGHPFLKFVSYTASERSRLTKIPFGDQAIFIRRDYFNKIGGFKAMPLMEDTELMKRIKKNGDRIKILDSAVVSSARQWQKNGIFINTAKNHLVRSLYWLGLDTCRLYRLYYGK